MAVSLTEFFAVVTAHFFARPRQTAAHARPSAAFSRNTTARTPPNSCPRIPDRETAIAVIRRHPFDGIPDDNDRARLEDLPENGMLELQRCGWGFKEVYTDMQP